MSVSPSAVCGKRSSLRGVSERISHFMTWANISSISLWIVCDIQLSLHKSRSLAFCGETSSGIPSQPRNLMNFNNKFQLSSSSILVLSSEIIAHNELECRFVHFHFHFPVAKSSFSKGTVTVGIHKPHHCHRHNTTISIIQTIFIGAITQNSLCQIFFQGNVMFGWTSCGPDSPNTGGALLTC